MTTTTEREEINNNYNCIDSGIGGSGGSSSGDQRSSPPSETIKNYSELISPQINLNKNLTTFSTSAAAPSSSFFPLLFSTPGMFANVVGYARSRLFKNANDGLLMPGEKVEKKFLFYGKNAKQYPSLYLIPDEQSPFHHSSLNLTKQKFLNQQNCCQSAQTTPFKKVESLTTTNEEKNKNFLNKNNNNKSCPVQRKQFSLSSKLQKEENFCSFSSPLDNWGSTRFEERHSGSQRKILKMFKCQFSSSIGSRESVLIENSSRTSSRQGEYFKSIKENKKEEQEHWQLFAVSLHKEKKKFISFIPIKRHIFYFNVKIINKKLIILPIYFYFII
ncbi:hypothetical protein Mgra_00006171 [Meloidogyne graminicola]|uniref:Uncharacterized protein n=1 Tax=Meloidogyne graminicola TaxID=189291 RepID=A0A8S9ZMV7_9BILA|nr:hypothetical protein Mgra_00006171 [Meloidogyne graminicola]